MPNCKINKLFIILCGLVIALGWPVRFAFAGNISVNSVVCDASNKSCNLKYVVDWPEGPTSPDTLACPYTPLDCSISFRVYKDGPITSANEVGWGNYYSFPKDYTRQMGYNYFKNIALGGSTSGTVSTGYLTTRWNESLTLAKQLCLIFNGQGGDPQSTPNICTPISIGGPVCTINGGGSMDVQFGNVERSLITPDATPSSISLQKNFSISCTGSQQVDFTIGMRATPTSWNHDAITTSNNNVGVAMSWNGQPMTDGSRQNMSVVGSNTVTLTFTPVRPSNSSSDDIATGFFNGSATLVVTQI